MNRIYAASGALILLVVVLLAALMLTPPKYDVSVDIEGDGTVTGTGTFEEGTEITLTAKGTNGQEFYRWSDGVTDSTRTIVVTSDIQLTAYFDLFYDVDVTLTYSDAGTVTGEGSYRDGDLVTLKATTNYGYTFSHWEENGRSLSTNPTYSFTVSSDCDIDAVYERMRFTVITSQNYSGGTVTGDGIYYYKDSATLRATVSSGYQFEGWYIDGVRVSTSTTYTLPVTENESVSARYSIIHDASFTLTTADPYVGNAVTFQSVYNVEIDSVTWTMTDIYNGGEPSWSSKGHSDVSYMFVLKEPSYVELTRTVTYSDGVTDTKSMDVVVDGQESRTLFWRYQSDEWYSFITEFLKVNNKSSEITLDLSFEWYSDYRSDDVLRYRTDAVYDFVTVDDPVIQSLADQLRDLTSGMTDIQRANCVLKLIQSITYEYDEDTRGVSEWYKYPAETLWDMNGDCEDHALLYATLMEALGYDTVLFHVYCYDLLGQYTGSHLAVGLNVSGGSGSYVSYQGVNYYYCEATAEVGTSWLNQANVGYKPSGYEVVNIYYEGGHVAVN